jgi:hypothetical protein
MAKIFVDYIADKVIIGELNQYHAYNKALRAGVPKSKRPILPQPTRAGAPRSLVGVVMHSTSSFLLALSEMLGIVRAQEWFAKKSITTDEHSSEPMSCGIHNAYTQYGLARLAQGDVISAIQSLSYSTKIHPCLHTTTYGLSYTLRNRLMSYAEAEDAIQLFDVIAWRFSGRDSYMHKEKAEKTL